MSIFLIVDDVYKIDNTREKKKRIRIWKRKKGMKSQWWVVLLKMTNLYDESINMDKEFFNCGQCRILLDFLSICYLQIYLWER